jgi:hypothetical protein
MRYPTAQVPKLFGPVYATASGGSERGRWPGRHARSSSAAGASRTEPRALALGRKRALVARRCVRALPAVAGRTRGLPLARSRCSAGAPGDTSTPITLARTAARRCGEVVGACEPDWAVGRLGALPRAAACADPTRATGVPKAAGSVPRGARRDAPARERRAGAPHRGGAARDPRLRNQRGRDRDLSYSAIETVCDPAVFHEPLLP